MLTLAAAFLPFAFAAGFTPGPNNLLLAASGANFGIRRTIPHVLGIVSGFPLLVLAVGLGLGTVFQRHPDVHTALKFVGGAFLVYLAWRIATAGHGTTGMARGRPMTFVEAVLFQWVNPKAWAMALTAITVYAPDRSLAAILLVAAIFGAINLPTVSTWTVIGQQIRRFLGSPARLRAFNWTCAALLVASLYPILTP